MTGYTVHTGSTEKFSEGWDQIFKGNRPKKSKGGAGKPKAKKKSAGKASRTKGRKRSKKSR
jgi:hypothetical protein